MFGQLASKHIQILDSPNEPPEGTYKIIEELGFLGHLCSIIKSKTHKVLYVKAEFNSSRILQIFTEQAFYMLDSF